MGDGGLDHIPEVPQVRSVVAITEDAQGHSLDLHLIKEGTYIGRYMYVYVYAVY